MHKNWSHSIEKNQLNWIDHLKLTQVDCVTPKSCCCQLNIVNNNDAWLNFNNSDYCYWYSFYWNDQWFKITISLMRWKKSNLFLITKIIFFFSLLDNNFSLKICFHVVHLLVTCLWLWLFSLSSIWTKRLLLLLLFINKMNEKFLNFEI